jgi:osmotically-inducible protein OsmY
MQAAGTNVDRLGHAKGTLMKNDMQIQQDVVAQLDHAQNVITGTLGVEVHHGVVKLAGRVGDSSIKKDAELAAGVVEGVRTVVMDVDVGVAGAPRPAADTTRAAETVQSK